MRFNSEFKGLIWKLTHPNFVFFSRPAPFCDFTQSFRRFGATYQSSSSRFEQSKKTGPLHCPKTSVRIFRSTLHKRANKQRSHSYVRESLKFICFIRILLRCIFMARFQIQKSTSPSSAYRHYNNVFRWSSKSESWQTHYIYERQLNFYIYFL